MLKNPHVRIGAMGYGHRHDGAISVTRAGAQSSIPSRAELDAYLSEHRHSVEIDPARPEDPISV